MLSINLDAMPHIQISKLFSIKLGLFSYSLVQICFLGAQKNRLNDKHKIGIIFLFISSNVCFRCSKELSQ